MDESYFQIRNIVDVLLDGFNARPQRKIGGAFLYEDTTTYIFSRTNYGKSLLVFQLAYAAATGTSHAPCAALQNDCPPMKVLVVDLELDARALYKRHKVILDKKDPLLSANLLYLHEKIENKMMVGFELLQKIEMAAADHGAQLVIIDNISKLLPDSLKPDIVTMVVAALNRIRQRTGASMLVIGHTTKGNPKIAIQPTDYFGSSMVQNFFSELSFLDKTADGRFFLCHTKTKSEECYIDNVPVFTRGDHPVAGVGFSYEALMPLSDVQLPYMLKPAEKPQKKRNLRHFKREISILDNAGVNRTTIAEMLGVHRSSIYELFSA